LQVVEAVVLAIVSDDFNLNQSVRRWLDEDDIPGPPPDSPRRGAT